MIGLRRWLACAAAFAGGTAAFATRPRKPTVDVAALARTITSQDDHISATELARWIRDRPRNLRVIDLRSADEFTRFHIPTAERVPLDQLTDTQFSPDDTIVVYSQAGVHAGQAWVFLRALGHHKVYFLRRGLDEWLDDIEAVAERPSLRGNTC